LRGIGKSQFHFGSIQTNRIISVKPLLVRDVSIPLWFNSNEIERDWEEAQDEGLNSTLVQFKRFVIRNDAILEVAESQFHFGSIQTKD